MGRDQEHTLLDGWVGTPVYLRQLGSQKIDAEDLDRLVANPGRLISAELADTASVVVLEGYDRFGITARDRGEGAPPFFVPWGGVLLIQGRPSDSAR